MVSLALSKYLCMCFNKKLNGCNTCVFVDCLLLALTWTGPDESFSVRVTAL